MKTAVTSRRLAGPAPTPPRPPCEVVERSPISSNARTLSFEDAFDGDADAHAPSQRRLGNRRLLKSSTVKGRRPPSGWSDWHTSRAISSVLVNISAIRHQNPSRKKKICSKRSQRRSSCEVRYLPELAVKKRGRRKRRVNSYLAHSGYKKSNDRGY